MLDNIYIDIRNKSDWFREMFNNKDMISIEDLINKIEDLDDENGRIKSEFEDFKQEVEDNYRPVSYKEQLGED